MAFAMSFVHLALEQYEICQLFAFRPEGVAEIAGNMAALIVSKTNQYAGNPTSLANNVKALKGEFAGLIRLEVLMRLARALGIDLEDLVTAAEE